jgi:hypothetical protein
MLCLPVNIGEFFVMPDATIVLYNKCGTSVYLRWQGKRGVHLMLSEAGMFSKKPKTDLSTLFALIINNQLAEFSLFRM